MRPIIGVTSQPKSTRGSSGDLDSHVVGHTYTDAVVRGGGIPVLLPPVPNEDVDALVERLDGLVLTGGGDVEPRRYGEEPHESIRRTNSARDEFEIALVREAKERRLPMLAICRGLQIVNVAFGGTLIQDIPTTVGSIDHTVIGHAVFDGHQPVTVESNSLIAKAIGQTDLMVNSIHHQAVKDLAPGFRAVAWAGDGVIEGIEYEDDRWPLLAVQWHPEYLSENSDEASRNLFASFVDAARVAPV
jgi:putative glutamine amidotransferase